MKWTSTTERTVHHMPIRARSMRDLVKIICQQYSSVKIIFRPVCLKTVKKQNHQVSHRFILDMAFLFQKTMCALYTISSCISPGWIQSMMHSGNAQRNLELSWMKSPGLTQFPLAETHLESSWKPFQLMPNCHRSTPTIVWEAPAFKAWMMLTLKATISSLCQDISANPQIKLMQNKPVTTRSNKCQILWMKKSSQRTTWNARENSQKRSPHQRESLLKTFHWTFKLIFWIFWQSKNNKSSMQFSTSFCSNNKQHFQPDCNPSTNAMNACSTILVFSWKQCHHQLQLQFWKSTMTLMWKNCRENAQSNTCDYHKDLWNSLPKKALIFVPKTNGFIYMLPWIFLFCTMKGIVQYISFFSKKNCSAPKTVSMLHQKETKFCSPYHAENACFHSLKFYKFSCTRPTASCRKH